VARNRRQGRPSGTGPRLQPEKNSLAFVVYTRTQRCPICVVAELSLAPQAAQFSFQSVHMVAPQQPLSTSFLWCKVKRCSVEWPSIQAAIDEHCAEDAAWRKWKRISSSQWYNCRVVRK